MSKIDASLIPPMTSSGRPWLSTSTERRAPALQSRTVVHRQAKPPPAAHPPQPSDARDGCPVAATAGSAPQLS